MIKMKATNIWPHTVDELIFSYDEVDESHGTVFIDEQGREQVHVEIEFKDGVNNDKENRILKELAEVIKNKTDVSMKVKRVERGTIKRSEFKARRWSDDRKGGLQQISRS